MIDNIRFYIKRDLSFLPLDKHEIEYKQIQFFRKYSKRKNIFYEGEFKHMRIVIVPHGIYISNSLSNLIYHNITFDLNYSEIQDAISKLCYQLKCNEEELIIRSLEFGITITTVIEPFEFLHRFLTHKRLPAKIENRNGKITGVKFQHTNYAIKIYDKGRVEFLQNKNKMSGNYLRIEQTFKKNYLPKHIHSAKDLKQLANIRKLFEMAFYSYQKIKKFPQINQNMPDEKLYRIYAILNPIFIIDRKKVITSSGITKKINRLWKELNEIGDFKIFDEIEQNIKLEFENLL